MNQANRTIAFVLCAVCSVGAAALTHYSFRPAPAKEAADVGEDFFPDFKEPSKATSLRVAGYNEKAARVDEFSVENKDGQWRIPSHHNYPADGKDRLAKTAASIIGVTRGQLVNTSADAQKRLGLLDPLDKTITGTEGRGNRITISAGDKVLADYIIGKKVEDGGDRYYVRRPDEARSYIAEIKPEVSTKFIDWIKPNLLDATSSSFRELLLDRYHFEEIQDGLRMVDGPKSRLTRDSSSADWKLDGLDATKDKLKSSVVNSMVSALADLKIVGVRPKPSGLGASLKAPEGELRLNPLDAVDLQQKGFYITRGGLYSNQGEYRAGTAEGVMYTLRFGEVFTGTDEEIEIGSPKKEGAADAKDKADNAAKADAEKKPDDPAKPDDASKKSRYVFITADFDEALLGEAPKEPMKPEPPPGYVPTAKPADSKAPDGESAPTVKPEAESKPATDGSEKPQSTEPAPETGDKSAETDPKTGAVEVNSDAISLAGPPADAPAKTESAKAAETTAADPPPDAKAEAPVGETPATDSPAPAAEGSDKPVVNPATPPKDPNAEYEAALKKYEQDLDEYKVKKQDHEEKVRKGKELVQKLNNRFADWYYVISAEVFDSLNVTPEQLIEPKDAKPATGAPGAPGASSLPGIPGLEPLSTPSATPAETPAPKTEKPPESPLATPPAEENPAEPAKDGPLKEKDGETAPKS